MRLIVIGELQDTGSGFMTGTVYFRYPVQDPARQQQYAKGSPTPQAPGAYTAGGADFDEVEAIANGLYVEQVVSGGSKFPQQASVAALAPSLEGDYQTELAAWQNREDLRFKFYGSSWDGSQTVDPAGDPPGWTINHA